MDDFHGLLARDFGFRPQGKSAPMAAAKSSSFGSGSASTRSATAASPFAFDDDVFGGAPKRQGNNPPPPPSFDSIFDGFKDPNPKTSSMPGPAAYDKPVYDDDIFNGVPGIKTGSGRVDYEDVFASMSKGGGGKAKEEEDDLLGSLGRSSSSREETRTKKRSEDLDAFDDLIPGFGGSSAPAARRGAPENNREKLAGSTAKSSPTNLDDPFVVLETTNSTSAYPSSGIFTDPLEQLGGHMNSGNANVDSSSPASGRAYDDIDAFDGLARSVPSFTSNKKENLKDKSPLKSGGERTQERSPVESPRTRSTRSSHSVSKVQSPKSYNGSYEKIGVVTPDQSPTYSDHVEKADDVWLTVSEVSLFTQPTSAPPPSRPPPRLVIRQASSVGRRDHGRKDNESFSHSNQSSPYPRDPVTRQSTSSIDELEDFAMGKPQNNEPVEVFPDEEDAESNSAAASSAAAMKEAMDRAEAKFKHAKEVRERERDVKSARSTEFSQQERDDFDEEDKQTQEKLDCEQREKEERERERRRLQKERELEREKARQAVERATREARERAAAEARQRAERAAVGKATAEARQRAGRAAVQRAASEARERAATDARERAERAAAEARERAAAEARERASAEAREKAIANRAAAEARENAAREKAIANRAAAEARARAERVAVARAHAEARERAAAAAQEKQQKAENDLESFFGMGSRATSAPKERATTSENPFDPQPQSRGSADETRRASSTSSTIRKASSTTNIVDDLSSIFGGAPSSGEFQDVEGETEERRRARLERHQRTLERAAKALAEKNERDMQAQRDQAERHRISETLDFEIKRWAAGKEGNLRALLSTLQYVLWPECGWQPVSLTDLITGAAVKKVYRKATLCIHPDKVQQKGANLQQKYIAEKVFDLLKEAWNKLNSEELF